MSFREKMHWAAFVGLAGAFGWYFLRYPWSIVDTPAGVGAVAGMLVMVTVIVAGLMIVTASFLAIRHPRDAHLKEDEREQNLHMRGTFAAYYPLVLGVYAVIIAVFNHVGGAALLNLLIAVVVFAELLRVGWQLWLYHAD